jgi:flagellar motor switch protein FliN
MADEEKDPQNEQAPAGEQAATATEDPQADGTEVQSAELPPAAEGLAKAAGGQIDILLDTTMPIEVRLGEVQLEVRDLLKLTPGTVVALDKMAGEPLDLYLKGIRFAAGQLVVASDQLGVRITEILPASKQTQHGE